MNTGGELGSDLERVVNFRAVAEVAEKLDAARCAELTGGAVTSPGTQTARLLAWLAAQGLDLPDTTRATIEEELNGNCIHTPEVTEVLQIRLRTARASTTKLVRMREMAGDGGALRGLFQFAGAARTGRWAGRGIQVQNLPRVPRGFSPDLFADMATATNDDMSRLDAVAPAPLLDCVSWSLRSCLKATDNQRVLWGFDFSQIEARVLAWLAGQNDVLAVFASGEDIYVWAAAQFGSRDRALGKVLILALGYGMGATKLRETARKAYGVALTEAQAESFKSGWRASNRHIVRFWEGMEFAAKQAVLKRGGVFAVGGSGVAFTCSARTLQMRLPSGRLLYYHNPSIELETGRLRYWGTELGRWAQLGTWGGKLAENATQAVARDIMSEAMLRVWRRDQRVPVMTVHDELVYAMTPIELDLMDQGALMTERMLEPPPWAGGLPIAGESKIMSRYGVAAVGDGGVVSAVTTDLRP
jgi:DNA polymerase